MAAAASPTSVAPPAPKAPPAAAPSAPPRPRVGELHDTGTVRRESVDAERWFASGLVKVTGDVNAGQAKFDGTISLGGKLTALEVRYRGTVEISGPAEAQTSLTGAGSLHADASLHAGVADLRGTVQVGGPLAVDRGLTVRGSLSAPSVKVGELDLDGEAEVPDELTAGRVTAFLKGNSTFGTVRGRSVVLRGKPPNLVDKVFFKRVTVRVARVEADTAELEAVEVRFVRAPQITLGKDAHVTEYEGTIVKRHPTSRVGFESKSPPPYGLRR